MNVIFMRHGESDNNDKKFISDKEIYYSTLTWKGKQEVLNSIVSLSQKIDKVYVSPFPRTIETAHFIFEKYPNTEFIIEDRIREINHGKYSGKPNNEILDNTRIQQIAGDYFVRLGEYGENNFNIESRLCEFLSDVYNNNFDTNTIMIVSHGSIISYIKRILNIKTPHIKTGKIEKFVNVDFYPLTLHIKKLKKIKFNSIQSRVNQIRMLDINHNIKKNLIRMAKEEFNNIEYSDDYFSKFMNGFCTKKLIQRTVSKFDEGIILICFYNNFETFAKKWIEHYVNIGVKNFVLVDNNSSDNSTKILKRYVQKVNISFWEIHDQYNCYKMCGWRQKLFEFYGINRKYLTVDSDELFIYEGYKSISIDEFLNKNNKGAIKSLMLDVYTNKKLFEGELKDFVFIDEKSYKMNETVTYGQRFYGGPRSRIFGINPSLQKIPFIFYTGNEIFANDHYYYPWSINYKAKFCSYILHYKFLPGDAKKYSTFAKDGRHWNNSHEYKTYCNVFLKNNNISFYDENESILVDNIVFKFK